LPPTEQTYTKTATQTFLKNQYEEGTDYPFCDFLFEYENDINNYNKLHRNGGYYFYLNVKNIDGDNIIAF